jgi:D-alanine-D-alanine ligase
MEIALVYNVKKKSENENVDQVSFNKEINKFDDRYAEWDDEETILAIKSALEVKHKVTLVEADDKAYNKLSDNKPQFIFNIAESIGNSCREALMPSIFEMLKIPYTGSDPLTLNLCLDKARTKEILSFYKIPTPTFQIIDKNSIDKLNFSSFPFIVKPLHEGSSKGIYNSSYVSNQKELKDEIDRIISVYNQPAIVEEYLSGREFTVALLGNSNTINVLPIIEFDFSLLPKEANKIYSYEAKWVWDTVDNKLSGIHQCPAKISDELKIEIENLSKKAFKVLNCRDWCRIDIRLDKNDVPNIIELNPLPGIIPNPDAHSCFPLAAKTAGMSYSQLINSVLDIALDRYKN